MSEEALQRVVLHNREVQRKEEVTSSWPGRKRNGVRRDEYLTASAPSEYGLINLQSNAVHSNVSRG